MSDRNNRSAMPGNVATIRDRGYATWADERAGGKLRDHFDETRIPVKGIRHVRVWGLQVDDERALPGRERTMIPDEEIWEITLEARDGSTYAFDSSLLRPAEPG